MQNKIIKTILSISYIYMLYIFMFILIIVFSLFATTNLLNIKTDSLSDDPKSFLIICTIPAIIALILLPLAVEKFLLHNSFQKLGINLSSKNLRLQLFIYITSITAILWVLNVNNATAIFVLIHYVVICFAEELLFRGLLQRNLSKYMSFFSALIISSLIFSIGFHQTSSFVDNLLIRFPLGLIFGTVFYLTKSLYPSFVLHLSYNMFVSFLD